MSLVDTQSKRFRAKGRVVVRTIGRDRLLVPVSGSVAHTNRIFPLNETGMVIWEGVSSGASVDEVAALLVSRFEVSFAVAASDVAAYVERLLQEELIEEVAS